MRSMGIILFLAHAVYFLCANTLEPSDCIIAEQLCMKDAQCNSTYHVFKNCFRADAVVSVNAPECQVAAGIISQTSLIHCKCQRRMKKEEHCVNIYWTVHPDYIGYLDSYDSPYEDDELDAKGDSDYLRLSLLLPEYDKTSDNTNPCLKEANICSSDPKCSQFKNDYVMYCADCSCDRRKCHQHLRQFFKRVPMEFTKRLLFCPCHQESCAERRRQNIVPKCSFEEKPKKNCLQLHTTCMSNNICKSRFLDYRKNCHLFEKNTGSCPPEQHAHCIQSYMGMIGTAMTPNFINNSSMDISLWCTCEGSSNQQEKCKDILAMFTSNRCLNNAISIDLNQNMLMKKDPELTIRGDDKDNTNLSVQSRDDQVDDKNNLSVLPANRRSSSTASGVSSPSLALTLLSPALFLWLLKVVSFM